jgi:predicted  nucleic acid-binding Zn-ribbon protein
MLFNQRLTNMSKTDAAQKRRLLNIEIGNLNFMENQLREQIRKLAQRGCELQRERIAKVEQLAELDMTVTYSA